MPGARQCFWACPNALSGSTSITWQAAADCTRFTIHSVFFQHCCARAPQQRCPACPSGLVDTASVLAPGVPRQSQARPARKTGHARRTGLSAQSQLGFGSVRMTDVLGGSRSNIGQSTHLMYLMLPASAPRALGAQRKQGRRLAEETECSKQPRGSAAACCSHALPTAPCAVLHRPAVMRVANLHLRDRLCWRAFRRCRCLRGELPHLGPQLPVLQSSQMAS